MKRHLNLIWHVMVLSGLLIIITSDAAQAQEKTNIKGHLAFDFPTPTEVSIELNLNGKLIRLVAKEATTELLEMLEGVYVRGYHRDNADLGEINRYYKNKLRKEGWHVIAKINETNDIVEVHILSDQDMVNGLFIIVEGNEETTFINIFGRINPEMIGELLDSLNGDDLDNFDMDLAGLGMAFELNLPEFDADYKPRWQRNSSGKWRFSEQLDWTLDGVGISVISAEATNGGITLVGSIQDKVIVRAFKQVRAHNKADAEKFAKKVQVRVEQHGKEIKIYRKYPKPPRGINVSVTYEIQCPSAVGVNLHATNGKIKISDVEGAVDAVTTNGRIELRGGAGRIHADTRNGKIVASVKRLTDEGKFITRNGSVDVEIRQGVAPVSVITTNGSINLKLPGNFSGQLDAKTSKGRVRSDFPVPFKDKSKKQLSGKIGEGGAAMVKLRTTNGSINLRKW